MQIAARFIICGRVQGVFFRAGTRAEAQRLGVCVIARNLADGRVDVLAVGTDSAIGQLEQWLQNGPPQARVDSVERHPADVGDIGDDS